MHQKLFPLNIGVFRSQIIYQLIVLLIYKLPDAGMLCYLSPTCSGAESISDSAATSSFLPNSVHFS